MKKIASIILSILIALVIIYQAFPQWILSAKNYVELKKGDFKTETIDLNGKTYYYLDNHRKDLPTLVLLHGFSDRKGSWLPFITPISKEYRLILLDQLGHGDNEKSFDVSHDFVSQAAFVDEVTKALDLPKFHLVGISMGGGVAGNFAAIYPDKIQSLTLISTAGINDYAQPSKMDSLMLTFKTVEEKKELMPLLPHKINRASIADFKEYLFYQNLFIPKRIFQVYMKNTVTHRDFYVKVLDDFVYTENGRFEQPLNDVLPKITCPVNVIWGKQDPLLNVSCVDVIEKLLPTPPTVTIIDECGHGTIAEKPKETLAAMTQFFDNLGKQ
jgi:abhydrolase domain-containing protein 6